jgi:hypothetical protein
MHDDIDDDDDDDKVGATGGRSREGGESCGT